MTADRREIVERVKKILALSQSPNEHEAAAAAAKAQELLMKHNLSMAEVTGVSRPSGGPIVKSDVDLVLKKNEGRWKEYLSSNVAMYNGCDVVYLTRWPGGRKSLIAIFVGPPENLEVVKTLYSWLVEQLEARAAVAWREYEDAGGYDPRPRWRRSFLVGAATVVGNRLSKRWAQMRRESAQVKALVLHREQAIENFKSHTWPILGTSRQSVAPGSVDGYMAGREAGDQVGIAGGKRLRKGQGQLQ